MNKDSTLGVYDEIRNRIILRQFRPDIKINQNQLAKDLHVSRTPVVKALHMLSREGLVDNVPNKGFYVHKNTLKETLEIYTLRQCIEMVAAGATAELADIEDIKALRNIFLPYINQRVINLDAYYNTDSYFHIRLIELSQNQLLQRINQTSLLLPKSFISGLLRSPEVTLKEHLALVDALEKRDVSLSQQLAKEHFDLTISRLKNTISHLCAMGIDPSKIFTTDISNDNFAAANEISDKSR